MRHVRITEGAAVALVVVAVAAIAAAVGRLEVDATAGVSQVTVAQR